MSNKCGCFKVSSISLGFALGITKGLCMMLLAWAAWAYGFGILMVQEKSILYPGFEASWIGGFYGLGWGILGGFVFGLVLGIIYNILLCCRSCTCCCKPSKE